MSLEVVKFTLVGAVNFVLTFAVFFVMVRMLGVNYLLSLTVAWAVGTAFTYVLNFLWVFKPEQRLRFRDRFAKYFLAGLFCLLLNLLALNRIVERTGYDPFYVQSALIPLIVALNFTTAKFWSLRPADR